MEQVGFKATESSPASVVLVRLKSLLRVNTKNEEGLALALSGAHNGTRERGMETTLTKVESGYS